MAVFKLIGGVVVHGFALLGLATYVGWMGTACAERE